MEDQQKSLKVSAIKNGTVIDHIPAKNLFKVINILGLDQLITSSMITFGTNLESKRIGYKGIIKLSDTYFRDEDINRIALVAPQAKLNVIKNYEVIDKKIVEVPETLFGIVKCVNPMCVTNKENVTQKFSLINKENIRLRCHYCDRITDEETMEII